MGCPSCSPSPSLSPPSLSRSLARSLNTGSHCSFHTQQSASGRQLRCFSIERRRGRITKKSCSCQKHIPLDFSHNLCSIERDIPLAFCALVWPQNLQPGRSSIPAHGDRQKDRKTNIFTCYGTRSTLTGRGFHRDGCSAQTFPTFFSLDAMILRGSKILYRSAAAPRSTLAAKRRVSGEEALMRH